MFICFYKGIGIEKNYRGFYTAFLWNSGRYCQCDTLQGCKNMIKKDMELFR